MLRLPSLLGAVAILSTSVSGLLKIASDLETIEYTPTRVTAEDVYDGEVEFVAGGISALVRDPTVDLGTNAEIPALRTYYANRNLRIIYTVTETYYRIVANKSAGIESLADLSGKRIGTIPGTTAGYFVEKLLKTAGVEPGDYTMSFSGLCYHAPCGRGTLPYQLAHGEIDAVALWEPHPQLALEALEEAGGEYIEFQDRGLYREIVNLHTTSEKLEDEEKRAEIVEFVRALEKVERIFNQTAEGVLTATGVPAWDRVAEYLEMDPSLVESVWRIHGWRGDLPPDLYETLVKEESWAAVANGREEMTPEEVAELIDTSVLEEARAKNDDKAGDKKKKEKEKDKKKNKEKDKDKKKKDKGKKKTEECLSESD